MPDAVLAVEDLHVGYGPIKAVRGCSFLLAEAETVAIIGGRRRQDNDYACALKSNPARVWAYPVHWHLN